MDSSVSPKDEIWFLRVCHHVSNASTSCYSSVWYGLEFENHIYWTCLHQRVKTKQSWGVGKCVFPNREVRIYTLIYHTSWTMFCHFTPPSSTPCHVNISQSYLYHLPELATTHLDFPNFTPSVYILSLESRWIYSFAEILSLNFLETWVHKQLQSSYQNRNPFRTWISRITYRQAFEGTWWLRHDSCLTFRNRASCI